MSFSIKKFGKNIWAGRFSIFPEEIASHGVSSRLGGVSRPPFASMNLALHVGDDPAAVTANRRVFCYALGFDFERLVTPKQVHGENIVRVTESDAGRGRLSYDDSVAEADALITDVPRLPLMLCYADCAPIMLLDPKKRVAAVVHGGWKGSALSISRKTVLRMKKDFVSNPEDILAAIGPAIGPCCYEVGDEVAAAFEKSSPGISEKIFQKKNGSLFLDLSLTNRLQLEEAGLLPEHIDCADVCTSCSRELFFSYRAERSVTGRIAAIIALK